MTTSLFVSCSAAHTPGIRRRQTHEEERAVRAAAMLPPHTPEAQELPESHRAGHYAHVAHMNMFENESPMFRIPAKICFLKLSPEEAEHPDSGLGDKKINSSDQAEEGDICSKLIEQVKRDMRLSDGEDKSMTSRSSAKERGKSKGRREGNANKMKNNDDGDEEWAKAKEKVEEFLDFPGVMAAMAYRNQAKSNGSSQSSSRNGRELSSQGQADPIPNTRHNAIFLRDHEKASKAILRNPQYQKSKQPPAVDSYQSATKSQDRGTKMAETPNSHVDNIEAESDTGNER